MAEPRRSRPLTPVSKPSRTSAACNGCGLGRNRLGGAPLQGASATEASGLAGLARDGINGGNDWGRLRGFESVPSPQDAPQTKFGMTGWTCGIRTKKTAGGRIQVGTIPSAPSVARSQEVASTAA